METIDITINQDEWYSSAEAFFTKMAGLEKEGPKYERMRSGATEMIRETQPRITIKAVCRYFTDIKLDGSKAVIGDDTFDCIAFQQIDPDTVKGAFVYAVSAGDFAFPDEDILNQVYADLWGTALTDALRLECKKELEKKVRLSDSFGPGFYGMNVGQMEKIARILDFDKMGLVIRENAVIVPLKSCAGIYFEVKDTYQYLRSACVECQGAYLSCVMCQQKKEQM